MQTQGELELEAERLAQEAAERLAAEQQAQEAAERLAAEQQAQEAAERLAAEQQAQEAAERLAAEQQAQEAAERLAAEQQAQEAAERLAAEQQAQEAAERLAAEQQAQEAAERLAAEQQAQEAAERLAAEQQAQEAAERLAAEQQAQEAAERLAAEQQAQEAAERLAAEQQAQEAAERLAAEQQAQEAAERLAAEQQAQEAAERLAAEQQAQEAAERLAAEQQAQEAAERLAAEQQAQEAQRLAAEQQAQEAQRLAAEQQAQEAQQLAAEQQAQEAQRLAAEQQAQEAQQLAAEQQAQEAQRLAAEQQAQEAQRLAAEQQAQEAQRLAAEQQAQEAQRLAAVQQAQEAADRLAAKGRQSSSSSSSEDPLVRELTKATADPEATSAKATNNKSLRTGYPQPPLELNSESDEEEEGHQLDQSNLLGKLLRINLARPISWDVYDYTNLAFSTVTSGFSLALYVNPTIDFGGENRLAIVGYLFSVLYANFGVSAFTASEAFKSFVNRLDIEFRKELNSSYYTDLKWKAARSLFTSLLAVAGSIPYMFASKDPNYVKAMIGVANAIMGFYALQVIGYQDYRRLKSFLAGSTEDQSYQKILASFTHSVRKISHGLINRCLEVNDTRWLDQFRDTLPAREGEDPLVSERQIIEHLADLARRFDIQSEPPLSCAATLYRKVLPTVVGLGSGGGMLIYVLKTWEQILARVPDKDKAIPITAGASFVFTYLAANFAIQTWTTIVDNLTGNGEKSLATLLYPWQTLAAGALTTLFVSASFATAADFVLRDDLINGDYKDYQPALMYYVATSAVFFNLFPNLKLVLRFMEALATRLGTPLKKELAKFGLDIESFLKQVEEDMSRQQFGESLKRLKDTDQVALAPMYLIEDNVPVLIQEITGDPVNDNHNKTFLSKVTRSLYQIRQEELTANSEIDYRELQQLTRADRGYGAIINGDNNGNNPQNLEPKNWWDRFGFFGAGDQQEPEDLLQDEEAIPIDNNNLLDNLDQPEPAPGYVDRFWAWAKGLVTEEEAAPEEQVNHDLMDPSSAEESSSTILSA